MLHINTVFDIVLTHVFHYGIAAIWLHETLKKSSRAVESSSLAITISIPELHSPQNEVSTFSNFANMTATKLLTVLLTSLLLTTPSSPFLLQPVGRIQTRPDSWSIAASSSEDSTNNAPPQASQSASRHPHPNHALNDERNVLPVELADDQAALSANADDSLLDPTSTSTRSSEFTNLEPLRPSPARLTRLEDEARLASVYTPAGSDAYWDLRDEIAQLEADLDVARSVLSGRRGRAAGGEGVKAIEAMLRRKQARDPEHVYRVTSAAARVAQRMGRDEEAKRYLEESHRAKKMMPQFNLEGLWVGKYGSHGFEMINITYVGDHLIAYKVTGDHNIPRGEVTFTADLSPPDYSGSGNDSNGPPSLDPIVLSEPSAKKWGTKRLPRYPGKGQAAEPGYKNAKYLEGQLVVIGSGEYFSFAWIPLEHQIFFGRPSPELTLKMLREGGVASLTAGIGNAVPSLEEGNMKDMTDYVARCFEVTVDTFWDERNEGKVDEFSGIWHGNDEYCYFE
ncbi:hypothetical protein HJC23_009319 [Cyclotella cryptica]|uniref:Uncharacterized protein n=1 Tax=Cyclotella cryptica TaxID=29204 RepID=A0ABD3QYX2_9STRA